MIIRRDVNKLKKCCLEIHMKRLASVATRATDPNSTKTLHPPLGMFRYITARGMCSKEEEERTRLAYFSERKQRKHVKLKARITDKLAL